MKISGNKKLMKMLDHEDEEFSEMTEIDWEIISKNAKRLSFKRGDIISKDGDQIQNFYRILSGKVEVRNENEAKYFLSESNFFGEFSFFSKFETSGKKIFFILIIYFYLF